MGVAREPGAEPLSAIEQAAWIFGFTTMVALALARSGSLNDPSFLFREGSPIDALSTIFLSTAAVMAWATAQRVGASSLRDRGFFRVSAAGFAFLTIDERFQLHERLSERWLDGPDGEELLGLVTWNDLFVVAYGVVALSVLAVTLPTLLRYRHMWPFLAGGFLFYAVHTIDDTLTSVDHRFEETMKVLATASLMLAYLQGFIQAASAAPHRSRPRKRAVATYYSLVVAVTTALLLANERWTSVLEHKWDDPVSWLAMVLLGASAQLCWFRLFIHPGDPGQDLLLWLTSGVLLTLLTLTEMLSATWQTLHRATRAQLIPPVLDWEAAVLHHPPGLRNLVLLVTLLGVAVFGVRRSKGSFGLLVVATASFLGLVAVNSLADGEGDLPAVAYVVAAWLLTLGSASALAFSFHNLER